MAIMKRSTPRHELFKYSFDVYSQLSLNWHLYTTDTSVKRTLKSWSLPLFTPFINFDSL